MVARTNPPKKIVTLARGFIRFAWGLRGFLSFTIDESEARKILERQLKMRSESFLSVLEHGVYSNERSPYRKLLLHAGFRFEDVRELVGEKGLEAALTQLHDAGVFVTLDEFKGRAPIRRSGLDLPVTASDFDNPLLTAHYEGRTGGSRGAGTRVELDLDFIAYDSASFLQTLLASGVDGRPMILWQTANLPLQGLRTALRLSRIGKRPAKWLSPNRLAGNRQGWQGRILLAVTLFTSRLLGKAFSGPRYMPEPADVATVLADAVQNGTPALLLATQSRVIRICLAAQSKGLDIAGTFFWAGAEPYTEGKEALIERVGARCITGYGMQEAGSIANACAAPVAPDDMHLLTDRLALVARTKQIGELEVSALYYTSLMTSAPKLLLNVESGDYAAVEQRDCGCLWQELGFKTHLHHVRSYEKLTGEGVMFMGSMLHELLEETLPGRFGGSPLDYQLVEEEVDGVTRVSVIVSPTVGPVNETGIIDAVVESLSFADWSRRNAEDWRRSGTLRIQRREPYITRVGKILPLHILEAVQSSEPR